MVGERRSVEIQDIPTIDEMVKKALVRYLGKSNSTSTQSEIFDVNAVSPNGWGVICDGNTIHISSSELR